MAIDRKNGSRSFSDKKEIISDEEDQKVQVIRKTANSKEEFERLKGILEKKGFKLYCKEYDRENEKDYYATILAEKELPPDAEDIRYKKAKKFIRKREKKVNLSIKFLWWLLIIAALLIYLSIIYILLR